MFENVVVGNPICSPCEIFAKDNKDWENMEKEKTMYTSERFLPKIMVDAGIVKSTSEVRRNRKELVRTLTENDYIELKWGKKHLFILVGSEENKEIESSGEEDESSGEK